MNDLAELIIHSADLDWLDDVACADMDPSAFFVEAGHTLDPEVQEVCRGCPARRECVTHAYERGAGGGHFGRLSQGQRKQMTLEQALAFIDNDPPRSPTP